MVNTESQKIDEILERGNIVNILPSKEEFRKQLLSGKRLRFYCGFDATAPTLHLGHARNIILLEKFRQLGHEIIVLFGDFTARIGDPTEKESVRKQLSREEVLANVQKWKELIRPLIDLDTKDNPAQIKYNNDWLSKLTFEDIIGLASNFTVQQMLERDMFQKRLKMGKPIYFHEFFYPLMQGYDSVAMEVDVEIGGTDQIFNMLTGRTLLKRLKDKDKFVVAGSLIENPKTGELMSKSLGTGVFLDISASDMYGQIMSQPDEMIEVLMINMTNLSLKEIKDLDIENNPKEAKMKLAYEIVKMLHGEEIAEKSREDFVSKFSKREIPSDLPLLKLSSSFVDQPIFKILPEIAPEVIKSNSVARKIIEQGGIDVDEQSIKDPFFSFEKNKEYILKIGKKVFKRIILN